MATSMETPGSASLPPTLLQGLEDRRWEDPFVPLPLAPALGPERGGLLWSTATHRAQDLSLVLTGASQSWNLSPKSISRHRRYIPVTSVC
jgi:hypothetical protein